MTAAREAASAADWNRKCRGFTLVELSLTIAIAGILAAFAMASINVNRFDTEGFANGAAAMVRYAQKLAINQHRTVVVVVSGNALSLCYTNAGCGGGAVHEPPGTGAFSLSAPSGVTIGDATISFSPLGRPNSAATLTITGDVVRTITVQTETGYVQYAP